MKNKKLLKNTIICTICFASSLIMNIPEAKAVLQSNGNAGARYNLSDWMVNVRKMEQLGGAMGLSETFNSNLTSSSASNNIDVHMQKNTEYGAMVILSASSYGNPNAVGAGQTTTGNVTGAVMKINSEWVAASVQNSNATNFTNAVPRYKNIYAQTKVYKKGDALENGIGASGAWIQWEWGKNINYCAIARSVTTNIFSYNGSAGNTNAPGIGECYRTHYSRAVIVQGQGL